MSAREVGQPHVDRRGYLRCGTCRVEGDAAQEDDHAGEECAMCGGIFVRARGALAAMAIKPPDVCWEYGPGGPVRLSFMVRVF